MSKGAVFLDRDGVLNPLVLNPATGRMESPLTPGEMELMEGVIPALSQLQVNGYPLILVSNQPNVALGKLSLETLEAIHRKLEIELIFAGIRFQRFCYCLHHPKGVVAEYAGLCVCRKPSPWFLLRARDDFGLSLRHSWMVGDQSTDIQCGKATGARTIRIRPASGASGILKASQNRGPSADYAAGNLAEAVEIILGERSR